MRGACNVVKDRLSGRSVVGSTSLAYAIAHDATLAHRNVLLGARKISIASQKDAGGEAKMGKSEWR